MRTVVGFLLVAAWLTGAPLSAQTRIVTGRVTDSLTGETVTSGQVSVANTTIGTTLKDDGTFTIAVPPRDVVLTIRSIGFKRRDVPVSASQNAVDVNLERDYFQLEAIVVTGQATGVEKRNLANAVATVNAAEVAKVSAPTLEQALSGKMAGVQLQENSGAPGGGMRVRLRGATSIIGGGNPLYVVDGVIASDARIEGGMNAVSLAQGANNITSVEQMNPVNRIADLNPNDIESVEVLKGASAAAIYGSKAANGVILITTKRGRLGAPRFQIRQGVGVAMRSFTFGSRYFSDSTSAIQAFGATARQHWTPGYTAVNLEDDISGYKPLQYETSVNMSGGTETTQYFASALVRHEGGIVLETFADKASVRLNLDQQVGRRLKLSTGTEVIRTANDRGMFGNDNAGTSYYFVLMHHPNFFDLRATCPDGTRQAKCEGGVYPVNPYVTSNPLHSAVAMTRDEEVWRMLTTGRAQLDAISSTQNTLRLILAGGFDQFIQEDNIVSPPELQYEPNDGLPGTVVRSFGNSFQGNVNANIVHSYRSAGGFLSATTQFGTQYEYQRLMLDRTATKGLVAGTPTVAAGSRIQVEQDFTRVKDFGFFGQEELLLSEKLLLTVGVRADRSSNNADTKKFFYYPKASASYRFTSFPGPIDELKLRTAFGQTGNRPLYGQKFTNLNATNVGGVGGVSVAAAAGAADAKPERQTEIEAGFDAQMLGGRALLEVSVYQKSSKDLLLQRTLAPVTGFSSEIFNGAEMRVRGLEWGLTLTPVRTSTVTWTSSLNWAMNRSKITKLPVPAFNAAGGSSGAIRIVEGGSATALWSNDTLPRSSPTAPFTLVFKYQADAAPSWTGGLLNTVQYRAISLSTSIEAVRGGRMNAGTWRHWDIARNGYDFEQPGDCGGTTTIGECRLRLQNQVPMNYWRNAGYVKLRELTLGLDLPRSFTNRLWSGIRSARVSLAGRNLIHLQGIIGGDMFKGTDPAAANYHSGNQRSNNVAYTREFAAYPSTRSFWFSLDLGF
ncbi:MAG: SusC/RagA family TonB-linked outer membrane protein [Gemmatimonadetes bacterium]|nr:SusC/RagA family TonB-linked outer membrane protein [Gemmatimonadota bacterium]